MRTGSSLITLSRSMGLVLGLLQTSSTLDTVMGRLGMRVM